MTVTMDDIAYALSKIDNEPAETFDIFVTNEQIYDLAFNQDIWSRIRRKVFGLNESEVRALILIMATE